MLAFEVVTISTYTRDWVHPPFYELDMDMLRGGGAFFLVHHGSKILCSDKIRTTMTIYATSIYVTGTMCNVPVYANELSSTGFSNLNVGSDMYVNGTIHGTGRMDVGATLYAAFRPMSNMVFTGGSSQLTGGNFIYDWTSADMTAMSNMTLSVPRSNIFNPSTGVITVPVSGLYNLEMQGSFSNSGNLPAPQNGVYYRFLNHSYSNARRAASMTTGNIVSTSTSAFLLAGDTILPTFYSDDSNAVLLANGETYVSFSVMATVTPTHSNYFRT